LPLHSCCVLAMLLWCAWMSVWHAVGMPPDRSPARHPDSATSPSVRGDPEEGWVCHKRPASVMGLEMAAGRGSGGGDGLLRGRGSATARGPLHWITSYLFIYVTGGGGGVFSRIWDRAGCGARQHGANIRQSHHLYPLSRDSTTVYYIRCRQQSAYKARHPARSLYEYVYPAAAVR
jgi:hypothetical protein